MTLCQNRSAQQLTVNNVIHHQDQEDKTLMSLTTPDQDQPQAKHFLPASMTLKMSQGLYLSHHSGMDKIETQHRAGVSSTKTQDL